MKRKMFNSKYFSALTIAYIILASMFISICTADKNPESIEDFDKGSSPSYKPFVPMKKTTFVNYDEKSYLDDYAYLAAVPTAVFNHKDKLYSHPLLFYEDEFEYNEDKYRSLNARQGLDYFMEDWMGYCINQLDQMILINVPESKVSQWNAEEYVTINGDNPYDIAKKIALHDWSYSGNAVVAVINEDFKKPDNIVSNKIQQKLPACKVKELPTIEIERIDCLKPAFEEFQVEKNYKHIQADAWWDAIFTTNSGMISASDPNGNPDIQLYYKHDEGWMQTAASCNNLLGPLGHKYTQSHVYKPGSWKIGITDLPTEGIVKGENAEGLIKTQGKPLKALISKGVTYYVDIAMYPGPEDIKLLDIPSFGCRDANFKLSWNNPSVNLGFSINGPGGEAIFTRIDKSRTSSQEIHIESIGECPADESYSISVFSTNDVATPVEFELEYSWKQTISKTECDFLTSASEGAVLASVLNAPLLYTSPSELSSPAKDVLYQLGVKNIYLVNMDGHLSHNAIDDLKDIANIKANYRNPQQIYDSIKQKTNQNSIIFTTIDPWTYWHLGELKPAGEKEGSLFVGPAAYIAAHHGSPVVIIGNHPRLSSSVIYHNELWRRFADNRYYHRPSTAEMVSTGQRVYDFLEEHGFDKEGKETIITVAGQYDIGVSWDRIFPGVANSGRFWGTPVDNSYWISRNMFYPALVFENPALKDKVELQNGSVSVRKTGISLGKIGGFFTGKDPLIAVNVNEFEKTRNSNVEEFEFPVLCSFITYKHRFNERASKYYGTKYTCADGFTPGVDKTGNSIDQGSMEKYTGDNSNIFPDMTESEVVPFYLEKGGYDCAFSTSMDSVVSNLNNGVIMWIHGSHGSEKNGGSTLFWNPEEGFARRDSFLSAKLVDFHKSILDSSDSPIIKLLSKLSYFIKSAFYGFEPTAAVFEEDNPWRGYEWYAGSTKEPDTMSVDIGGIIPYGNIRIPFIPASGVDNVISYKPIRTILNQVIPFFDPFNVGNLYDGAIGSIAHSKFQYDSYSATEIEENLENLYSAGFITSMCQTSNTYFHLMLIRHGSVFQVQNPWSTSLYGAVWQQSIPKDIILGHTAGEAYSKGMSHVGNLYLGGAGGNDDEPQWWWDTAENVVYFGDPNLRVYVPDTEFSNENNWEKPKSLEKDEDTAFNGHTPFGATSYPHARQPETFWEKYFLIILLVAIIVILLIGMFVVYKRRGKIN